MKTGDDVVVTNLNGETAEGRIVEVLADRCDERPADFLEAEGYTLADYWHPHLDNPGCPVVRVELGTRTYDYPAERVEVVEE